MVCIRNEKKRDWEPWPKLSRRTQDMYEANTLVSGLDVVKNEQTGWDRFL